MYVYIYKAAYIHMFVCMFNWSSASFWFVTWWTKINPGPASNWMIFQYIDVNIWWTNWFGCRQSTYIRIIMLVSCGGSLSMLGVCSCIVMFAVPCLSCFDSMRTSENHVSLMATRLYPCHPGFSQNDFPVSTRGIFTINDESLGGILLSITLFEIGQVKSVCLFNWDR